MPVLGRFASKALSLLPMTSQGPCALCSFGVKSLNHEGSFPGTVLYVYALRDNTDVTQKGGGCRSSLGTPCAHGLKYGSHREVIRSKLQKGDADVKP